MGVFFWTQCTNATVLLYFILQNKMLAKFLLFSYITTSKQTKCMKTDRPVHVVRTAMKVATNTILKSVKVFKMSNADSDTHWETDDDATDEWLSQWLRDTAWLTLCAFSRRFMLSDQWCVFSALPPAIYIHTRCNRLDLKPANLKATVVFLHFLHFYVTVQ